MAYETPQFGDFYEDRESLLPHEDDMPLVEAIIGKTTYKFTWHDTHLVEFEVGGGTFDHFLHDSGNETTLYFFFKYLSGGEELRNAFKERRFKTTTSPILDEATIALYARMEAGALDVDLKTLLTQESDESENT